MQQPPEQVSLPLPTSRPRLTYLLLLGIVGVFVVQVVYNQVEYPRNEPITAWGALNYTRVVFAGEHYRLFTAMFLHADQVHLLMNALALWIFGRTLESLFGTARFALIYFLGGLCGSLASLTFTRGFSVGASGAVFATFGAVMVFLYFNRELLGKAAQDQFRQLLILAALNFGLGIFTQFAGGTVVIDNWGHVGGFVGGIVLTWFIGARYQVYDDPRAMYGLKVVDERSLRKTWLAALLFGAGLALLTMYTLNALGG